MRQGSREPAWSLRRLRVEVRAAEVVEDALGDEGACPLIAFGKDPLDDRPEPLDPVPQLSRVSGAEDHRMEDPL